MKFGIYNSYWEKDWGGELTPYVQKVKRLGFDVLEVSFANAPVTPDEKILELGRTARGEGIHLTAGYGPPRKFSCTSDDPNEVEAGIEYLGQIFRKMDIAGIRLIGGGLYSYWPVDYAAPIDKPRDWERAVLGIRRAAAMARDYGITLGMEVLNRFEGYLINTAAECRQFVKDVGAENIGVMLDTFHMNIEEDRITGAIQTAGDMLCHLHVGEANRRLPGPGGLAWDLIGEALHAVNFDGCVVMEPFVRMGGQIGSDIKVWRDLSGGADDKKLDEMAEASVKYLRSAFTAR
jgi:D-psicose/D-tagatose/L-ribulose 3-epimerase